MATQTVEFRSPPSQTVTAKLFAIGSDAQVASVSSTEATNRKGTYSAAFTDIAAGEYELIALVGSVPVARWFVTLTLTTATFQARDKVGAVELDSAVEAVINDIPNTAEFQARTLAAASYATASQINSLQVNTRASVHVPVEIETPDSGTQVWKIRLFLFDSDGNMEAPDSTPTVALVNASGTDRSSRLSAATTLSTGAYSWDYTSTDDDAEEQLNWTFTVVEGGLTRIYPATSYVVEETAYRFTSTDRSTLNSRASSTEVTTVGTAVAAVSTKIGTPAGASIAADIAAIGSGGGGGGDATLAKQEEILTAVESVVDTVAAYAARMALEVQLRGFPNVICRNADYLIATESEIRITIEDLTGTAITEIAGTPVASLSWLFGMGTEQDPALIAGTCTWDAGTDELVIEIAKAATAGKQTGSLTWQIGVSIGAARRWLGGGTTRLIERQF